MDLMMKMHSLLILAGFSIACIARAQAPLTSVDLLGELPPQSHQPQGGGCGQTYILQTNSNSVLPSNSITCHSGGVHFNNSFFRAYPAAGIPNGYSACSALVGIQVADAAGVGTTQPLTVRLYANSGTAFPGGTRTLLASQTVQITDQAQSLVEIPLVGTVPAGSELVIEAFTPSAQELGHSLFLGSNTSGQTRPAFTQTADCGIPTITSLTTAGFPNMHLVLFLDGVLGVANNAIFTNGFEN